MRLPHFVHPVIIIIAMTFDVDGCRHAPRGTLGSAHAAEVALATPLLTL